MSNRKDGVFKISVANLVLDQLNPRLYGESAGNTQTEILQKIYKKEQINELSISLANNGYFAEEPIILIPENESDFDLIDHKNYDQFRYLVIEGNRRTSSVKLLLDKHNEIVDTAFPKLNNNEIKLNLEKLPSIIYRKREDVDIYLSIRHITGNKKWDSYAKSKYVYDQILKINQNTRDITKAISKLSIQIGDKNNVIKKYYIYHAIFKRIEKDAIQYPSKNIKERFSLLEVSLQSGNTSIAQYIGLKSFKNTDFKNQIVSDDKIENLKDITKWIFGNDEDGTGTLIKDVRNINLMLKPVLTNEEATTHLKKYNDLEGAFELTDGEENFMLGNLKKSTSNIAAILAKVKKYKNNQDFKTALSELNDTIHSLKILMKS